MLAVLCDRSAPAAAPQTPGESIRTFDEVFPG
jgi:hypothetical protein